MQNKELTIRVNPRLHITLIGMNLDGFRINGGCGFAIQEPSVNLDFSKSKIFRLSDLREYRLPVNEVERLSNVINSEKDRLKFQHSINIEISGQMPTHFGFGSDTAIRLACMEALYSFNKKDADAQTIVMSSGRGGTSGIGINTYFSGGFIVDLGRKKDLTIHFPSSLTENRKILPLLMQRLTMPDWEVGICMPSSIANKSEEEERDFFRRTCPVPSASVNETLYNVIYGLYASLKEQDKQTFCAAIIDIQKSRWKLAERSEYGRQLTIIEDHLYGSGADAVGMTSLGPSLFFFANDVGDVISKMNKMQLDCQLFLTRPINEGRNIEFV